MVLFVYLFPPQVKADRGEVEASDETIGKMQKETAAGVEAEKEEEKERK